MSSDGCTAFSWKKDASSFLAQNWDWRKEQKENLIRLCIQQNGRPNIDMITEAGIIGKIGLNHVGVGVCLNAIRANGVDFGKLPCHLALRRCLESDTREDAVATLLRVGVASACHILVADANGGTGLECSNLDIVQLPVSNEGILTHTNHFLKEHPGVHENIQFPDTKTRLERINFLLETVDPKNISAPLMDEEGSPTSINRKATSESTWETLFSIVMDLKDRHAQVSIGRPSAPEQKIVLRPGAA